MLSAAVPLFSSHIPVSFAPVVPFVAVSGWRVQSPPCIKTILAHFCTAIIAVHWLLKLWPEWPNMTRHRGPKTDRWLWMSCDSAAVSTVEQNYAANPSNSAKRKKKPWLLFRLDILNNCSSDIFPHTCVLTCGACAQENATWDLELCFPTYGLVHTHTLSHTQLPVAIGVLTFSLPAVPFISFFLSESFFQPV